MMMAQPRRYFYSRDRTTCTVYYTCTVSTFTYPIHNIYIFIIYTCICTSVINIPYWYIYNNYMHIPHSRRAGDTQHRERQTTRRQRVHIVQHNVYEYSASSTTRENTAHVHSTRRDSTARLALELLVVLLVVLLLQRPRGVTLRGGGAAPAARALISAGHGLLDLLGEHEAVRARLPLLRPLLDVLALLARAKTTGRASPCIQFSTRC